MHRYLALVFALLIPLLSLSSQAQTEPVAATESPSSTPVTLKTELVMLQQAIDTDIRKLKNAKGELKTIVEYRIQNKTLQLRNKIKDLLEATPIDKTFLQPLIQGQLNYIQQIDAYIDDNISKLEQQLGSSTDDATLLEISKRELEKDTYYKQQLETLTWLEQVGQDISEAQKSLMQILVARADTLESLVTYTQQQLQAAIDTATNAGKDVTSAQTSHVMMLKERLAQNSQSLNIDISLLDALGHDTSALKKTLFSVSGDITQDVLNFDVASSLVEQWLNTAQEQAINHGPTVVFKLFVFCLILFIAGLAGKLAKQIVKNTVSNSKLNLSKLLQDFFTSLSGKVVFTIGLLIALSQLGIELGPLLAGFGIAGVIIGFALQDTLSNFASGMMILIYRPYDVGDLINAAGVTGRVSHMSLVSTTIKTMDNQRLIIPNNKIWGDTINNITAEHQRRVDMTFGISYSDSIEQAEAILKSIVKAHPKVQPLPEPTIKLHLLSESSVDFIVRPWAKPEDYWEVYWDITREVKMRFDAEGISIPFPQRDVHIYQTTKSPL
ncbi:mechanosensitive ion channel family protein [Shewanella sp. SW36]|uniref:mechanosensitive ion channel family protein n=1 Tax=Shewanella TaxID=22 RepID=UPI0021D806CA|nr:MULTISPECIES: mechanosensitive ion channel family protein [unclassified Shewanella]MCU7974505.1 mechanosensitive ion channel family protein [Shewanella sp. SW36]MCU7989893.1 mechanosensitive ion channel family protein [Shewanella sp. SW1]MCU8017276.1 mechanosensitive ion channel family protein [Shewanella sp. SM72]MCU8051290.1 mechanosensitive ion channel family protein [Shewanella sp. SM43]